MTHIFRLVDMPKDTFLNGFINSIQNNQNNRDTRSSNQDSNSKKIQYASHTLFAANSGPSYTSNPYGPGSNSFH